MNINSKVYVAGHSGMVGSAIFNLLKKKGYSNILNISSNELDLRDQSQVDNFIKKNKPDNIIIAAAKVGGILANDTYRAEFIYDNIMIQSNLIHSAYKNNVKKLLFLGSSCIYPKDSKQPIKEEYILTSNLEYTNEPYAIAKISGIKMCENYFRQYGCNFFSVMPTNLYGPGDNYDLESSHVIPGLIRKFYEAKINNQNLVKLWGSGRPLREFLHVDDMANACIYLMENLDSNVIYENFRTSQLNIGTGKDISIKQLAEIIRDIMNYDCEIIFDKTKPDGTYQKLLDTNKADEIGWKYSISLREGLKKTIDDFKKNIDKYCLE